MLNAPPSWIFLPALACWWFLLMLPGFRSFDNNRSNHRSKSIDGLRGLLAVSVFVHHFAITTQWQKTGEWRLTNSPTWNLLGEASVTLFFMITGLLFFEKARANRFDIVGFFIGRFFRIYPVYILACALALIVSLFLGNLALVTPRSLVQDAWNWLTFVPSRMLGYDDAGAIVAFVSWSLRYEWFFYTALPLLWLTWRYVRFNSSFVIVLSLAALFLAYNSVHATSSTVGGLFVAPFFLGGLVGLLGRNERLRAAMSGIWGGVFVVLFVVLTFATQTSAYHVSAYLLLMCVFTPVALGNTFFGFLSSPPLQILGAVSYDIYLLHGIVLFVVFRVALKEALTVNPFGACIELAGVGLLVIVVALASHRMVEQPFQHRKRPVVP